MGELDSCSVDNRDLVSDSAVAIDILEFRNDSASTDCFRFWIGEVLGEAVTEGEEGMFLVTIVGLDRREFLLLNADMEVTCRN
jgi:dimeric dUTPase (all-alpha-NTP-PPase superfamily)